jgi:hypothetical protein
MSWPTGVTCRRVEHVFAQLGRWRQALALRRGTKASARAWLEVASVGYLLGWI